MKRHAIPILLCLLLLTAALPASAAQPKVIDHAGLLTQAQAAALEEKAQALADAYQMDVVILTVDSLDGRSSEAYADDYFDEHGYGLGQNRSGILFLLAMSTREWAISTSGDAIYAFTDYGIETLFSGVAPYLSEDDYNRAFQVYLESLPAYFEAYASGSPIDGSGYPYDGPGTYEPGTQEEIVSYPKKRGLSPLQALVSLAIGGAAASAVIFVMRSQMNTAKPQHGAMSYVEPGSYTLKRQQDLFLYSHVTRTRRAESSGGGHHGGGSSVHTSSGGGSHGGGHGHF